MRRILSALGVVGLSAVLVFVAVPAQAVDPLPPPVEPIPALPSTYSKTIATGSGQIFQDQIAFNLYVRQQMAAKAAAAASGAPVAASPVSKAVPVTGVRAISGAGAGSILTAAFMAGWMITDGTLAMYTKSTGSNPLQGACGWGDFGVAAVQVLYPFSASDCKVAITSPNDEIPGIRVISYSGNTLSYVGKSSFIDSQAGNGYIPAGWPYRYCWSGTGPPAGVQVQALTNVGVWVGVTFQPNYSAPPYGCGTTIHTTEGAPSSIHAATSNLRYVQSGTSTVVASSTETKADPNRVPKCTLTWPGGATTVTTGDAYKESGGFPFESISETCNEGFVSKPGHGPNLLPTEIEIGSTREDTGTYAPIQEAPVPEYTPDEKKGLTPGTLGGLILEKIVGNKLLSCMTWAADCSNWWTDTSSGTDPTTGTGEYRCRYNGDAVALVECGPYRNTFQLETSTPTITDPTTGTETPWVPGTPAPTQSGTLPLTGTNPTLATAVETGGGGCSPSWSWNPVDWVLNPLRCAFIPSTAAVTTAQTALSTAWTDTAPGAFVTVLAGWSFVPPGGGCEGLVFEWSDVFPGKGIADWSILNACPGSPLQPAAIASTVVISIACLIGLIVAISRAFGGVVGMRGVAGD